MISYKNGNTFVKIFDDGTKIREYENTPIITHPESIDIKVTQFCDMGCKFCFESSTVVGQHGDLVKLLKVTKDIPAGVEFAIGGGNPLSHPNLSGFLNILKWKGIISNLTVNQGHLKTYALMLKYFIKDDLIKGLGISIVSENFDSIKPILEISDNIVFHLIAGVHKPNIVNKLVELAGDKCKILVLGYKKFGFGLKFYNPEVDTLILEWKKQLRGFIRKTTLCFDNLAIEQLEVRKLFTKEGWEKFYMGDDFCFTMYIDAVKQEFAPTSRSVERVGFSEMGLLDYFRSRKQNA